MMGVWREVVAASTNNLTFLSVFALGCNLNIELGDAGKKCGDVLVRLAQLGFILGVLGLVVAKLSVAFNFDSFVLSHQLLHLRN